MKTPFDTVLRMRRREIDRTRIAIHMETTRLTEIDEQSRALEEELAREYEVCAQSWAASAEAFVRRRMAQQADLVAQRVTVSEQIGRLRREAIDAYGSQHVLESAAEGFRADHRRQQSRAEQREADDLCAARLAPATRTRAEPTVLQLPIR
jgi:hypothetical protein|tara:strand:- start:1437 stop:1889 length:453 start_codon:yes stop_codon:yes gene_type:complete